MRLLEVLAQKLPQANISRIHEKLLMKSPTLLEKIIPYTVIKLWEILFGSLHNNKKKEFLRFSRLLLEHFLISS